MSFQALKLKNWFEGGQTLTITSLRRFRKEHLQKLCEANCIEILHDGKKVLKENYVQALFSAVSGYYFLDTGAKEFIFRSLERLRLPVNEWRGDPQW